MTPYQLKRSILTAAIQGRITNQDEAEGTGDELLVANAIEKKRRLAVEKVKAGKLCRPITEEDSLFDIPSNWSWARFGDLVLNYDSRRRPVTKEERKTTKGLYDYYGATGAIDRVDEYIFDGEFLMIGEDGGNFFVDRDNSFIANGRFWANNHVHVVQPVTCEIWYLKHCLDAYNMPNMGLINGIAVPKLNQENLNSIMIPVPPLSEQKRIVAKIEELLPLIDRYEQAWSKLEEFNKRFPVDMQKSILQMAIQGKLVEQRPEEGTGEELFEQIQIEKKRQIKNGILRKTKALPIITEDQLPGTFPDSWKICYIDDIAFVTKLAGFEYSSTIASNLTSSGIPLFKGKNVQNGKLVLEFESYIPEKVSDELPRSQILKRCLLTPYVGTIGNIAIFDGSFKAHLGSNVGKIELLNGEEQYVLEEYVLYYLRSDIGYRELTKYKKATAQESISIDAIRNVIIAIPPLNEQKRIVAKLEEILPLCERLK